MRNLNSPVMAASGFHGMVRKATPFMVGEGGAERVDISPISDIHKLGQGIGSGNVTNIYITESMDLRGAYGITSPDVAEDVYKKVWAPARRRVMDRFMNSRGKVVR
jgi:hypothetical protein